MKVTAATSFAALAGVTMAAKDTGTFSVLRFNGKEMSKGRVDPILAPGETFTHVHSIMGGSGFSKTATGKDLLQSKCSNAQVKGDNSAYWFPSLYFHDPKTGKFESVDLYYFNAYYFFEATNDDIKAFPVGLSMVSGESMTRSPPKGGASTNLDPSKGDVNPAMMTCPRLNNAYNPPSWPANSDGTMAGMGNSVNLGEGVGFPDRTCDGTYSPLRADIHFPSCYNPAAGLTNHKKNMAWPTTKDGKQDCPEGYIHVPHLFYEVYWDTQKFKGRWEEGKEDQPFVFSNGDVTGYSNHADFLAGWDETVLQNIIDTCNTGTAGMNTCPGLTYGANTEECTAKSEVDEKVSGTLDKIPGDNPLSGWKYGNSTSSGSSSGSSGGSSSASTSKASGGQATAASSSEAARATASSASQYGTPEKSAAAAGGSSSGKTYSQPPAAAQTDSDSSAGSQSSLVSSYKAKPTTSCKPKVHTVWETVTVTSKPPSETMGYRRDHVRRHVHDQVRY